MSQADWHLRDLLQFYVSRCQKELLFGTGGDVDAQQLFEAVQRVRELMLLMSCMVGAFTPSEIQALNRLEQVRLVAENQSAQMLRIGEDMAMLRLWMKTALDPQYNMVDAVKILSTGRMRPLPEMTLDLLTSFKKPFIVPTVLPDPSIGQSLRELITFEFRRAKSHPPYIPSRIALSFHPDDDSVIITSPGEFHIRGIFDKRSWTIMEAQILDDTQGAPMCRRILQLTCRNSTIAEMCCAILKMATAQRIKVMYDEAAGLIDKKTVVCSLSKSQSGLGQGFKAGLFKRLDVVVEFGMNQETGDLQVGSLDGLEGKTFFQIIDIVIAQIETQVMTDLARLLVDRGVSAIVAGNVLVVDAVVIVVLTPNGLLSVSAPSVGTHSSVTCLVPSENEPGTVLDIVKIFLFLVRCQTEQKMKERDRWVRCALPNDIDVMELPTDVNETLNILLQMNEDTSLDQFRMAFVRDGEVVLV